MSEDQLIDHHKYIASFPELSPIALKEFTSCNCRKKLPAIPLFFAHYKAFPCSLVCSRPESNALLHVPSILNYLTTEFGHDETNDIIIQNWNRKAKQFFVQTRLSNLEQGIMIFMNHVYPISHIQNPNNYPPDILDDEFLVSQSISIYYLPEHNVTVCNMAKEFLKLYIVESKFLKLNFIVRQRCRYYLKDIKIKKPLIFDIALHYGENFAKIHNKILKQCNEKKGKGIVLLHGIPGSGKTHYVRYLIEDIREKKLIYVPPNMISDISKPEFLAFLLRYPNSILIIEDAENIIHDRNKITLDASQAVANLLNLSDGLLSDAIHMQIIATFNCDLTMIDKALLRKGRLIADYEFGKLDVENAKVLSSKLGFNPRNITTSMTLAEIYNQNKEDENGIYCLS